LNILFEYMQNGLTGKLLCEQLLFGEKLAGHRAHIERKIEEHRDDIVKQKRKLAHDFELEENFTYRRKFVNARKFENPNEYVTIAS